MRSGFDNITYRGRTRSEFPLAVSSASSVFRRSLSHELATQMDAYVPGGHRLQGWWPGPDRLIMWTSSLGPVSAALSELVIIGYPRSSKAIGNATAG